MIAGAFPVFLSLLYIKYIEAKVKPIKERSNNLCATTTVTMDVQAIVIMEVTVKITKLSKKLTQILDVIALVAATVPVVVIGLVAAITQMNMDVLRLTRLLV